MERRIRVLCVPSDTGGCGLHRSLVPHQKLAERHGDEFYVVIDYQPNWRDLEYVNSFDIIHFHKGVYQDMEGFHNALKFCKENNITTVMDVDDNWELGQHHPLYLTYKRSNMTNITRDNLSIADYVTTTTPIFAKHISKFNPNVKVFVNAIDDIRINEIKNNINHSNKLRIGFVMGSTHKHDMELVNGMLSKISPETLEKVQFVLCGFDTRGTITEIHPDGTATPRPIRPEESVWFDYEKNITDNYRIVSPMYRDFLLKFIPQLNFPYADNEHYKRCWTKTVDNYEYMKHYNELDVLFVPLQDNTFNSCKSELKFIEAGMMGVAVVASNFGPYTVGSVNFFEKGGKINENGNCVLIDNVKAHKEWGRTVERLVKNPEYVTKLKENMHKHIMENYHINDMTADRANWYKQICKRNE
jgi:glycosyltransferase involved in cell wall biosynthesis